MGKRTKKRDWLGWSLLTSGVILGALAMLIYLYPTFFVGRLESSDQVSPKVKGEVKAASSGTWEEEWKVKDWRWAKVRAGRTVSNLGDYLRGWVLTGPYSWEVCGEINGQKFHETWTGEFLHGSGGEEKVHYFRIAEEYLAARFFDPNNNDRRYRALKGRLTDRRGEPGRAFRVGCNTLDVRAGLIEKAEAGMWGSVFASGPYTVGVTQPKQNWTEPFLGLSDMVTGWRVEGGWGQGSCPL